MKLLAEDYTLKYYIIDSAGEIDEFQIGDFDFFHLYGINNYRESFEIWMRRFPRPTFIIGAKNKNIVAFIYIDPWEEVPDIVNVLRAQETVKSLRGKKIGYKLFLLGIFFTPEQIITKPLTAASKKFYENLGFVDIKQMRRYSDYHSITGYLVLPINKKNEHLMIFEQYFTALHL